MSIFANNHIFNYLDKIFKSVILQIIDKIVSLTVTVLAAKKIIEHLTNPLV